MEAKAAFLHWCATAATIFYFSKSSQGALAALPPVAALLLDFLK
jgi:hypothetical protein